MNIHELRDELPFQKITNQLFSFEGKTDLHGKLVETILPSIDVKAFKD